MGVKVLRVFWKALCLTLGGLCFISPSTGPTPTWGYAVMYVLGSLFVLFGIFTELDV